MQNNLKKSIKLKEKLMCWQKQPLVFDAAGSSTLKTEDSTSSPGFSSSFPRSFREGKRRNSGKEVAEDCTIFFGSIFSEFSLQSHFFG